jgi:hypothetical protein
MAARKPAKKKANPELTRRVTILSLRYANGYLARSSLVAKVAIRVSGLREKRRCWQRHIRKQVEAIGHERGQTLQTRWDRMEGWQSQDAQWRLTFW